MKMLLAIREMCKVLDVSKQELFYAMSFQVRVDREFAAIALGGETALQIEAEAAADAAEFLNAWKEGQASAMTQAS